MNIRTSFGRWTLVLGPVLVALLVELLCILVLNGGSLSYALDDAYIHLSLGRQIAGGHYGLWGSTPASPSSSIVWPFLLAPFAKSPGFEWVPLLINFGLGLAFSAIVYSIVARVLRGLGPKSPDLAVLSAAFTWLLVLCTNLIPSVFLGLEHTLQLTLVALGMRAVLDYTETGELRFQGLLPIFVGPLVRYENLSVALALSVLLVLGGRMKLAFCGALISLAGPIGFGLLLKAMGLPVLPTSILAKSDLLSTSSAFALFSNAALHAADGLLNSTRALLLGLGIAVQLWVFSELSSSGDVRGRRVASVALWTALSLFGHLCFGEYGRYELYVWTQLLLALAIEATALHPGAFPTRAKLILVSGLSLVASAPYLGRLFQTPFGAHSIFAQQGTMARLAQKLDERVAVNDIGLVSFRSRNAVVDLWGLGALDALQLRKSRHDRTWMDEVAETHGVRFVMIYDTWFQGQIPKNWIPVGTLEYSGVLPSTAERVVTFYARGPEAETEARRRLAELGELPSGLMVRPSL